MATNAQSIGNALPQLVRAEALLSAKAAARGITYAIADFGGVRSESDTTKILKYRQEEYDLYVASCKKKGVTPVAINVFRRVAPFGQSYHNFGAAFDVKFDVKLGTKKPAGMTDDQALEILGSLAGSCGLTWGKSFGDVPHFQLSGPIGTWQSAWKERGKQPGVGAAAPVVVGVLAITGLLLFALLRR